MNFPNVPNLPGVPPVMRNPLAAVTTLAAPIISALLDSFKPVFGVFDEAGAKLLEADTFISLEYTNQRKISAFPVEKGSFTNYNKVNDPFRGIVRAAKGGTLADREAFIASLQALADSLDLVKLVTPEAVYINVNMEGFSYKRTQTSGANQIIAECKFVEIRLPGWLPAQPVTPQAKSPSAMDKIVSGLSKPIEATGAAITKVTGFLSRGI